jgi:virulence-associated protein VagC
MPSSEKKVVVVPSLKVEDYLKDLEMGVSEAPLRTRYDAPTNEEMGCNDAYDADKGEDPD